MVDPVEVAGQIVSSSRIRALVSAGKVDEAPAMLGRPYRIRGVVVRGAGRGAALGYPTANVGQIDTLLPGEGIYAARACAAGMWYPAAVSLGPNPTFGEGALKVEAYLVGFQGMLYEQPIEVDFLSPLRKIERFASVEALVAQMARDVAPRRRDRVHTMIPWSRFVDIVGRHRRFVADHSHSSGRRCGGLRGCFGRDSGGVGQGRVGVQRLWRCRPTCGSSIGSTD